MPAPPAARRARLVDARGGSAEAAAGDAPAAAAAALLAGRVLAVKGIGGFHLACRADDEEAVARLRGRKHREDKPFALMVPSLDVARELVELGDEDERVLLGRDRPIVVAPRRGAGVAPRRWRPARRDLGVMLPYSPLHHLLMAEVGVPLVMTSGNVSDEPIAYRDDDALERLAPIADLFLIHDRPIETRTDDSVVRTAIVAGRPQALTLRRSRGRVPRSLPLVPDAERPILACGAELKSTFCLVKGRRAWVGHHIGDLKNWETLRSFREGVSHFERLFAVEPEVVAHDLHPDYLSTRYALEREGVEQVGVQHHHAHLAACLAEYGEEGPAVGAIFDGSGFGTDGTVWGGEILVGDCRGFERAGHLAPGPHAGRRPRCPRAVADGLRLARRGGGARPGPPGGASRKRGRRHLAHDREACGGRPRLARHDEHGPAVRRRGGAVWDPGGGDVRGSGRGGAGGGKRRVGGRRVPPPGGSRRGDGRSGDRACGGP